MNSVVLTGRLTKDPDVNYTQGGNTITKFTVAVDRRFKSEGQPTADFISCICFGKTAEFVEKWFHKGDGIGLSGRIQTGSYTNKEGNKVYTTDIVCDQVEFGIGGKQKEDAPAGKPSDDFIKVLEGFDDGLPFE